MAPRARDVGFYLHSRVNEGFLSVRNARRRREPLPPLEDVLRGDRSPVALARLLAGRDNAEREAAVGWYLDRRGVPRARHRFHSFEGEGENLAVEVGSGDRVLVLVAHHDAVPGSPGANDNAVSVGILLSLLERLEREAPPPGLRVRLLFTAAEERFYLGARAYVGEVALAGVVGVLSLELCGIGNAVVFWDAPAETPLLRAATGALGAMGLRPDETYHVVGRVPLFGSDHRAFAAAGIPAYGLSVMPAEEAAALRRFVFSPVRSALVHAVRRPPRPFDTYHTRRDALATLEPAAADLALDALAAIIAGLG